MIGDLLSKLNLSCPLLYSFETTDSIYQDAKINLREYSVFLETILVYIITCKQT
jgi:hypothetical protein